MCLDNVSATGLTVSATVTGTEQYSGNTHKSGEGEENSVYLY